MRIAPAIRNLLLIVGTAAITVCCYWMLSAGLSHFDTPRRTWNVRELAGCYSLEVQAWQPLAQYGADAVYVTPPSQFRLFSVPARSALRPGSYRMNPTIAAAASPQQFAYWWIDEDGRLVLVWTTGLSGVTVELQPHQNVMTGSARTFWDFERAEQHASARATRHACTPEDNS